MDNLESSTDDALLKFHHDVLWWKSVMEYSETEISFINRLLNSNAFETNEPKLIEKLDKFKHQIKTEIRELKNLKEIIDGHENKMRGMIECEDMSCDAIYLDNHESLKLHFEKFFKNFSEYKTKVFNYTGSVFKKK